MKGNSPKGREFDTFANQRVISFLRRIVNFLGKGKVFLGATAKREKALPFATPCDARMNLVLVEPHRFVSDYIVMDTVPYFEVEMHLDEHLVLFLRRLSNLLVDFEFDPHCFDEDTFLFATI
jgi:hypothetical protein